VAIRGVGIGLYKEKAVRRRRWIGKTSNIISDLKEEKEGFSGIVVAIRRRKSR